LERPLPLSEIRGGKRHVPQLIAAKGVPFLRYSKPQPVSLGRVIRQRGRRHKGLWTKKEELEADRRIAEWEDDWDDIVEAQMVDERTPKQYKTTSWQWSYGSGKVENSEDTWSYEVQMAEEEVMQKIRTEDRYYAEMGKKMWDIVVKERELAAQEESQDKIQRRIERKAAAAMAAIAASGSGTTVCKATDMADEMRDDIR